MADFDLFNDTTPKLAFQRPSTPTVAALRTALTTYSGSSYPAATTRLMSENDLLYAARLHGLTVAASQSV